MYIQWHISDRDVTCVKKLVEEQTKAGNHIICTRKKVNLHKKRPGVDEPIFWRTMVNARLTTQQRSGPRSPVENFMQTRFPLVAYSEVYKKNQADSKKLMAGLLQDEEGIRWYNRIAEDLAYNLARLEEGEWKNTLETCNGLSGPGPTTKGQERKVASQIARTFKGFGPKQSRNLLQMLGLTRYEIPIDSRLAKWLRKNILACPSPLTGNLLSDSEYYEFVLDGVQELCERAGVFPCIFDAAVFTVEGRKATSG